MRGFDHFSPEALVFLSDLKANNYRDWFHANKKTYENEIREPAKDFSHAMSEALGTLTGIPHKSKIYRINRDIRFSRDKTPYNAHLHISFAPQTDISNAPMWFFGLGIEKLSLGCGIFQFDKAGLDDFRAQMGGKRGVELTELASRLQSAGVRVSAPELKRIPSGFDKAHPNSEALRRKGFSAWKDLSDTSFVVKPKLVARAIGEMKELDPVFRLLSGLA